jgi:hypothetical protein
MKKIEEREGRKVYLVVAGEESLLSLGLENDLLVGDSL